MNKQRRKELAKAKDMLTEAMDILVAAGEEEQEYAENMPENMQGSEKFEKAEQASSDLMDAVSEIENLILTIDGAIGE